jgi:hypothetical protein
LFTCAPFWLLIRGRSPLVKPLVFFFNINALSLYNLNYWFLFKF